MSSEVEKYNRRGLQTSYVSTVIGISLVLFLIGIVLGGIFGLEGVQNQAKENLQANIFFKIDLNATDIKQISEELKTWNEFKEITYISPERALEEFSKTTEDAKEIEAIFEGENIFPPNISFHPLKEFATKAGMDELKAKILAQYPDEVESVNYDKASVDKVNLQFKQFTYLIILVGFFLLIIAFAMINNTIRLALYSKRFTIKTMQLVGAQSRFIRQPFLWQAVAQGAVSSVIGMALLMTLYYSIDKGLDVDLSFSFISFLLVFGILILFGVIMTWIFTLFALNKFLKMKLDDLY